MSASLHAPALELRTYSDRAVLRFTGCDTLDEHNAPVVSQQLALLPDDNIGGTLVLDLNGIRYLTSTVLGTLVSFNRRVRSAGGRFVLENVSPFVHEALVITRLDQLMEVQPADSVVPTGGCLPA